MTSSSSISSSSIIVGRHNPRVKGIRALARSREARERSGLFFAEGLHLALAAQQSDRVSIEQVVVCRERLNGATARSFVAAREQERVPLLEVSAEVFSSLVTRDSAQGVAVVIARPPDRETLCAVTMAEPGLWVALQSVQYPGNLGTILRIADAVGCAGVVLLDNATDPYDPASVRASMGGVFSQRLVRARTDEFAEWKRRTGVPLIGASPSAAADYRYLNYPPRPLVLLMGQERGGLSPRLEDLCDTTVRIPMTGRCDSLNLAVSTAILLYAIAGSSPPLPDWERGLRWLLGGRCRSCRGRRSLFFRRRCAARENRDRQSGNERQSHNAQMLHGYPFYDTETESAAERSRERAIFHAPTLECCAALLVTLRGW